MNNTIQLFAELQATSSRKEKEQIIKNNRNNIKFISTLSFLLDSFIVTGISKKKIKKEVEKNSEQIIHSFEELQGYLAENNTGTDEDIYQVQMYLKTLTEEQRAFVEGLITKSLRVGVTAKTLNKIIPNSVREFSVMLAVPYKDEKNLFNDGYYEDLQKEIIITTKLDGVRNVGIVENGNVSFYSRQGKPVEGLVDIEKEMKELPNGVYDGELIANLEGIHNNKDVFEQTIKRSRIKGTKKGLKYMVFDYIENKNDFFNGIDKTPCNERKNKLNNILNEKKCSYVEYLNPLYIGTDYNKIYEIMQEQTSKGEEGIMINISDGAYECKRTKDLIKYKQFNDADVLVTDIIEGEGKNTGKLGAITIIFEGEDKLNYYCNVGSGFTDEERVYYWNNKKELLNKIVTIQYFEMVGNKKDKNFTLRFPVWTGRIRNDKKEISMY